MPEVTVSAPAGFSFSKIQTSDSNVLTLTGTSPAIITGKIGGTAKIILTYENPTDNSILEKNINVIVEPPGGAAEAYPDPRITLWHNSSNCQVGRTMQVIFQIINPYGTTFDSTDPSYTPTGIVCTSNLKIIENSGGTQIDAAYPCVYYACIVQGLEEGTRGYVELTTVYKGNTHKTRAYIDVVSTTSSAPNGWELISAGLSNWAGARTSAPIRMTRIRYDNINTAGGTWSIDDTSIASINAQKISVLEGDLGTSPKRVQNSITINCLSIGTTILRCGAGACTWKGQNIVGAIPIVVYKKNY